MAIKALKSISRTAMVLILLSIIPPGVFASENVTFTSSNEHVYDPRYGPVRNITEENFSFVENLSKSTSRGWK